MICALRPSRRKMCAKLFITVVVPAPDDPVTAMMGCWVDMSKPRLGSEHRALVEERRAVRTVRTTGVLGVVAFDTLDFVAGSENQRNPLMQRFRHDVEQAFASGRGAAAGLLGVQAGRVGFVQKAQQTSGA